MPALVSLLAVVALAALVAWMLGSAVLRGGGLLLCIAGLIGAATGTAVGASILALMLWSAPGLVDI